MDKGCIIEYVASDLVQQNACQAHSSFSLPILLEHSAVWHVID
jgi:hypothetical protein